jgi:hypothetical protein
LGDFDGDGRLDLVSGSNCCDPETIHLFLRRADGTFGARREIKFERPGLSPAVRTFARGRSRPHLFDWDRDGKTDLVIANLGRRTVLVSPGPLAGKAEVAVKAVELPACPDEAHPVETGFADWDGDGAFDLLVAAQYRAVKDGPWRYAVYWFRNTAPKGEPKFAAGARLVTIPAPWELNAFAVVDRELVVSVSKDWERKTGGGRAVDSKLWRYRRRG